MDRKSEWAGPESFIQTVKKSEGNRKRPRDASRSPSFLLTPYSSISHFSPIMSRHFIFPLLNFCAFFLSLPQFSDCVLFLPAD